MSKSAPQYEALLGVSVAEIVALCQVNRTTAARWKADQARIPAAALALIMQSIYGILPPIAGATWQGWRFGRDGRLYAPDIARGYLPGHVRALDYLWPLFSSSEQLKRVLSDLDQTAAGILARHVERDQDREQQE